MKFVDLAAENQLVPIEKIENVLKSGKYLLGEQLDKLEKEFAKFIGVKNAIGVKNCTDAIMLVMRSVYKPGMPVILPNFGAYPTAVAVNNFTKKVYYVDVDETMTIDTYKLPEHVKNGIMICVHLFGNNCDMEKIKEYCKTNNHILIEDCAQSTGSGCGAVGDYSVFSFYPTKPLASMGDGGMICTNYERSIFDKLRFYGLEGNEIKEAGVNSRMDEIQSAVVLAKFPYLQELNMRRKQISVRYEKLVKGYKARKGCVYHQYVLITEQRKHIIHQLEKAEIPYMIHYPKHVPDLDGLKGMYNKVDNRINHKCISLPCHPFMKEEEIQKVESFLYESKRTYPY